MKRYPLYCPECGEMDVHLPSNEPDKPYCIQCEKEIDIESARKKAQAWLNYLADLDAMLEQETLQSAAKQSIGKGIVSVSGAKSELKEPPAFPEDYADIPPLASSPED